MWVWGTPQKITFQELVAEMVREYLKTAEKDGLVKRHGYTAYDRHE
jgi:GDPmannose 4,6-dehydratase